MRQKQLRQGILLGLYALIALWLISLIWGLVGKARVAMNEARDAERQYETLEARRVKLQANLEALNTPLGRDGAIRTAFGVARSGEEVIVVVPPAEATTTPDKSWWQKLRGWF